MTPSRWLLRLVLLAAAFTAGTVVLGWWTLPALGVIWGVVGRATSRPALTAGVAASLAWVVLLGGWSAVMGPVGLLAAKLGGIAQQPGGAFLGLTVVLPFALVFTAARIPRR